MPLKNGTLDLHGSQNVEKRKKQACFGLSSSSPCPWISSSVNKDRPSRCVSGSWQPGKQQHTRREQGTHETKLLSPVAPSARKEQQDLVVHLQKSRRKISSGLLCKGQQGFQVPLPRQTRASFPKIFQKDIPMMTAQSCAFQRCLLWYNINLQLSVQMLLLDARFNPFSVRHHSET